jgi:hypothetical protein
LAFLEPLLQPEVGLPLGIGRDSPAAGGVKLQELAIEAQQLLGLLRLRNAGNGGLGVSIILDDAGAVGYPPF